MFNIFKSKANVERQLVEKGQFLGSFWVHYDIEPNTEAIIDILNCAAELELSQPAKMDSQTESKLFAEILSFYLLFAHRVALEKLSNKERVFFFYALFSATQEAAAKCKKADSMIQEESLFLTFYKGFYLEHSKFNLLDKEADGNGSLCWEFSKRISSMAHLQKGPNQDRTHQVVENLLLRSVARLCLPTLLNKKKTSDDWEEALENAAKKLDELWQKHMGAP